MTSAKFGLIFSFANEVQYPYLIKERIFDCPIYGKIKVSKTAAEIIAMPEFQRLSKIRQMGLHPAVNHSRFEHSIGTYYLTGVVLTHLITKYPDQKYSMPHLSNEPIIFTERIIELIMIAGLCHDIGHGPYSHVFDKLVVNKSRHPNRHHVIRSCLIVKKICRDLFTQQEIDFIINVINPVLPCSKLPLYQIVANQVFGIDIDRMDYLQRDSYYLKKPLYFNPFRIIHAMNIVDDHFAFNDDCLIEIQKFFQNRFDMHRKTYNNSNELVTERMLTDNIDKDLFEQCLSDMDLFCTLTDKDLFIKNVANSLMIHSQHQYKIIADILDLNIYYKMKNFRKYICEKLDLPLSSLKIIQVHNTLSGIDNLPNPFSEIYFCSENMNCHTFTRSCDYNRCLENKCILICKDVSKFEIILAEWQEFAMFMYNDAKF